MNRGRVAALLAALAALAGIQAGCAARQPAALEALGLTRVDDELRGVVRAAPGGAGPALYALAPRALLRAEPLPDGWSFVEVARPPPGTEWHGMTAGDVDGDGDDEIVVWGFVPRLSSVVLGGGGETLRREADPVPWLLRATARGDEVWLIGQRAAADRDFGGDVVRFRLAGGALEPGEPLGRRVDWDVLGPFWAPAADAEAPVMYVWDADGGGLSRRDGETVLWRDEGLRMARPLWAERERVDLLGERSAEVQTFPTEVVVADLDGDGVDEVAMVTSDEAPLGMLERVRAFRGGSYQVLGVAGRGLRVEASSILIGRFLTGVALLDADGDGELEAVVSAVLRRRSGVARGISALVVLDAISGDLEPTGRAPVGGEPAD